MFSSIISFSTGLRLVGFLTGSAFLVFVSRASLRYPRSHGFFRFFAWECILGLFVLNVLEWFHNPLSPNQLVSWFFLMFSLYLIVAALYLLRRYGKVNQAREDVPLVGIEKTTKLVTEGIYRYIRHPMYSSLLFLAWGIFLKQPNWVGGSLVTGATVFLILTAKADEAESAQFFGQEYVLYIKQTKRFIPFIF